MTFSKIRNRCFWSVAVVLFVGALAAWAQAPAAAPAQAAPPAAAAAPAPAQAAPAPAAAPAVAGPAMDAPLDVKAAKPPSADDLAKGDPGGTMTGNVNDVVAADAKKGLTLADLANQAGQ